MLISSMIRTSVWYHFSLDQRFFFTFRMRSSIAPCPRPMPAKEWRVLPPTFRAARPVYAVTATLRPIASNFWTRRRRRKDLPVPAGPRRSTFSPASARRSASCCLGLSSTGGEVSSNSSAFPSSSEGDAEALALAFRLLPPFSPFPRFLFVLDGMAVVYLDVPLFYTQQAPASNVQPDAFP